MVAVNAKASVVTAALDITYVLFAIVAEKLTDGAGQSEHYATLSTQTLSMGVLAFRPFRLDERSVAKPIRLPVRVIFF